MSHNERTIIALRALANHLSEGDEWVGESVNHALSEIEGEDDADRLLTLLLDGVSVNVPTDC